MPKRIFTVTVWLVALTLQSLPAAEFFVAFSADTRVVHNVIRHLPYSGMSIGYRWSTATTSQARCLAADNHIHEVMQKLADGGGIYTLSFQPGTVLRGNLIHDVHRSAYAHGGAPNNGFFIDEGSKDFRFESNVVHATAGEGVRFNQNQRAWREGKPTWLAESFPTRHGAGGPLYNYKDYAKFARAYYGTLLSVDDSVGRLYAALDEPGQLENTVIIFTADNDFAVGIHGRVDKRTM